MFKTGKGATVVVSADARARAAALFASSPLVERALPTEGGAGGSGSVPSPIALRASSMESAGLRAPLGPPPPDSSHAAPSTAGAAPARLPATSGFLTGKGVAVATDPAAVARMRAMLLSSPDGADANDGADAIAGALPPRRGSAARPGAPAATNLGRSDDDGCSKNGCGISICVRRLYYAWQGRWPRCNNHRCI